MRNCPLILAAVLGMLSFLVARAPAAHAEDAVVYLPVIFGPPPTELYGSVTVNGAPAPDIEIALIRRTGGQDVVVDSIRTDSTGLYRFLDMELTAGAQFRAAYVNGEYGNQANRSYVYSCLTEEAADITSGARVRLGDFDIADIVLQAPPHDAEVLLPTTFRWLPRTGTPGDNYYWTLFDPQKSSNSVDYRNLGNADRFTLAGGLPEPFTFGVRYGWYVGVTGASSSCESLYYRNVTFTAGAQPSAVAGDVRGEPFLRR
jgi:hypothetical protein